MKNRKIGIFGGSFDPIHNGHLAIAKSAYQDFDLDEVWFIPAGHSPNKKESNMTPAGQRAKMTELAIASIPYFQLSRIEIEAAETSFTYLTLEKLKKNNPLDTFYFIMGADSLDYFEKWRYPDRICACANILVAVRDDWDCTKVKEKITEIKKLFQAEISLLSVKKMDVSSHKIRSDIANGIPVGDRIPDAVEKYIKEKGLYQNDGNNRNEEKAKKRA